MALDTTALPTMNADDARAAQAASDRAALAKSFSLQNPLMAAGMDVLTLPGRAIGGAYNTAARLPAMFGVNLPTISDTSPFFGGNSASMTPYYDRLRTPEQPATAQEPAAPAQTTAPPQAAAPAPTAAAPTAPSPVTAPAFMPTLTGPNTVQDMVSEGRDLMATQGIGGLVQAKGLNRLAQTVNQANEPYITGQYGLQRQAMTANEQLEQAKLAEQQRQQQQETWTPIKNMLGELEGFGRTKGGRPEFVTKESLMEKPTLAQYIARNSLVNPNATQAQHEAQYKARYGE